jgi:hypothetical protein
MTNVFGKGLQAGTNQLLTAPSIEFAGLAVGIQNGLAFGLADEDGVVGALEEFSILLGQQRLAPQPLAKNGNLPLNLPPQQDHPNHKDENPASQ